MKSEELFEIDRQINQIRRGLEQRQEKVAGWDVPLAHILKVDLSLDRIVPIRASIYRRNTLKHICNIIWRERMTLIRLNSYSPSTRNILAPRSCFFAMS